MRKLTLYCSHAPKHYAAAQEAITQVGLTKKFRQKSKSVAGEVDDSGRGIFGNGAFHAVMDRDRYVQVETWVETCHMLYAFSWPHLRLLSMRLDRCSCGNPSSRSKG